jgi:sec-independent protein translocase protein TatC
MNDAKDPQKKDKGGPDEELERGTMGFWEHLDELRSRLVKAALAFAVGGGVAWYFKEPVLIWTTKPFIEAWGSEIEGHAALNFQSPAALFLAYIKLSVVAGLIFSLPVIFYQIWAFVAPGLYSKEKRLALPFVAVSTGLFAGGAYFGWKFAFPMAFKYLLSFAKPVEWGGTVIDIKPTVMIGEYLDFTARFLLAFGAAFELPVVIFFLTIIGVVNHIQLLKFSRYFILIAFLIAAVITPPDIMSQFLLAIPLCLLYFLSILIAWIFHKRKQA